MSTPKRNPTNADLMQEIKAMQHIQAEHGSRLTNLEAWKIASDAVAEYKKFETPPTESKLNKELIKYIGVALGIIASLVYLLQGLHA